MPEVIQETVTNKGELQEVFNDISAGFRRAEYRDELDEFNDILYETHADSFALASDSDNSAWPPLAAATVARKRSAEILVETGRLRTSLTTKGGQDHVGEITDRGLTFGTEVPYSVFHQLGTRNMPQRAPVGVPQKRVDELTETITDAAARKLRKVS
jgi:phage gpG-like protein